MKRFIIKEFYIFKINMELSKVFHIFKNIKKEEDLINLSIQNREFFSLLSKIKNYNLYHNDKVFNDSYNSWLDFF